MGQLRQVVIILPDQEGEISINRLGNQMTGVLLGSGVTLELGQGSRITSVPLRPSPQETYIRDTEINRSCQTGKTKMSLLKFMPLESMMPSALLILCHPFSSCLQSFPASGSFPMSQLFASGGQSIRTSALATVLPVKIQDWVPLGWTGWISLQSKGLSRVFSNKSF